jgi:hypothetical protein
MTKLSDLVKGSVILYQGRWLEVEGVCPDGNGLFDIYWRDPAGPRRSTGGVIQRCPSSAEFQCADRLVEFKQDLC